MPTLSEAASKDLLRPYELPFAQERLVDTADEAVAAASSIGFPVVAKLCGDAIAHKTERGLVRLGLRDADAVRNAASELLALARPEDGHVQVLVAELVRGRRELIAGVVRDPQFGLCVMLGIGGILAEAIEDVVFRVAPIDTIDAHDMIDELSTQKLLGAFRGEPALDRSALADVLVGLSRFATAQNNVESVDCNPLIICDGRPVIVDALVEVTS